MAWGALFATPSAWRPSSRCTCRAFSFTASSSTSASTSVPGEPGTRLQLYWQMADCVLVDGTMWTDDEMIALGASPRSARAMGHLPQSGPEGMLSWLQRLPATTRKVLIHINNTNPILDEDSPERAQLDAAGIAKSRGIPVYTIGSGKEGIVPVPVYDDEGRKRGYQRMLSDLDEGTLREIATQTGGRFFRVAETGTIEEAFRAIDRAQKIEFQAKSHLLTTELFWWAATPGLAALLAGAAFARPFLKREAAA